MTQEQKRIFTLRITQAKQVEMIIILYEITLVYLDDLENALKSCNREDEKYFLYKIRECMGELIHALDYQYTLSLDLLSLYRYCSKLLVKVDLYQDVESLEQIRSILIRLRTAYQTIKEKDSSEAVMLHTQKVYAGLTYDNSGLNESVTSTLGNRGYLA